MADPLPIPRITGARLTLRPHEPADLDAVYERCLDPDTRRFTTIPLDYTRAMAEEYLAAISAPQASAISWAIERDGAYAGTIDLRRLATGAGDLGFVTHPRFRGQGLMTDAVGVVVAYAFEELDWELVQWKAHAGNWASAKAVWRNGFPLPTFVPSLLVERDSVVDGWISTLRRGASRAPVVPWEQVVAALEE